MLGDRKSIVNEEFRGVPAAAVERGVNFNTLWGNDYIIFEYREIKDTELTLMVEGMVFLRIMRD